MQLDGVAGVVRSLFVCPRREFSSDRRCTHPSLSSRGRAFLDRVVVSAFWDAVTFGWQSCMVS